MVGMSVVECELVLVREGIYQLKGLARTSGARGGAYLPLLRSELWARWKT